MLGIKGLKALGQTKLFEEIRRVEEYIRSSSLHEEVIEDHELLMNPEGKAITLVQTTTKQS